MGVIHRMLRSGGAPVHGLLVGTEGAALSGQAVLDGVVASGGASSTAASGLSGGAALDGPAISGGVSSTSSATISDGAVLDSVAAGGGLVSAPSGVSGGALLDGMGAGGSLVGFAGPVALIGPRTVIVGKLQTPTKLDPLDVAEIDDVTFRFHKTLRPGEMLLSCSVTAEVSKGIDSNSSPLLAPGTAQSLGTDAQVRVNGALAVPGVTYLLRCTAFISSGRNVVGTALLKVQRQS